MFNWFTYALDVAILVDVRESPDAGVEPNPKVVFPPKPSVGAVVVVVFAPNKLNPVDAVVFARDPNRLVPETKTLYIWEPLRIKKDL